MPEPDDDAILVLVNRLAIGAVQLSVFNFSERDVASVVRSAELPAGATVVDLGTSEEVATVEADGEGGSFEVRLRQFGFQALILKDVPASE